MNKIELFKMTTKKFINIKQAQSFLRYHLREPAYHHATLMDRFSCNFIKFESFLYIHLPNVTFLKAADVVNAAENIV